MVVARRRDAAFHLAREQHFHVPQLFIFQQDVRAALFQFARQLRGIPFDGEVQISQRRARDQVPYRAARQIQVEAQRRRKLLRLSNKNI
jgi:hypothetical protein